MQGLNRSRSIIILGDQLKIQFNAERKLLGKNQM